MKNEQLGELLMQYQFGPERVLKNIIAVDWSIEALLAYAKAQGERCSFWTFTFKNRAENEEYDVELCVRDWSRFLKRLRDRTGVHGLRVFEWGKTTGRFHVHAVFDRYFDRALVDELKANLETMGHSKVKEVADGNLARYLWKELTKQLRHRRADAPRRLWATFGRLAGFSAVNDITIVTEEAYEGVVHDFWKEAKQNASEVRTPGESGIETWKRAQRLYWYHPRMNWSLQGLASIEKRLRGPVEHGDAYEEAGGGDTDFDVASIEKGVGSEGPPHGDSSPVGAP